MINYETEIKPLEDAGKNLEQIADALSFICVRDISQRDAKLFFSDENWWYRDRSGLQGSFEVAYADVTHPQATITNLDKLYRVNFEEESDTLSRVIQYRRNGAARGTTFLVGLGKTLDRMVTKGQINQGALDDFYALGGGLKHGPLVAADIAAAIAAWQTSETQRIADDRLINAKALFSERMASGGDANAVWSQAWIDAEAF